MIILRSTLFTLLAARCSPRSQRHPIEEASPPTPPSPSADTLPASESTPPADSGTATGPVERAGQAVEEVVHKTEKAVKHVVKKTTAGVKAVADKTGKTVRKVGEKIEEIGIAAEIALRRPGLTADL